MVEGKLSNLIKLLDAHTNIRVWEDEYETNNIIYSSEVWKLYNLIDKSKEFMSYYIKDMIIDYDGIRVMVYSKQY